MICGKNGFVGCVSPLASVRKPRQRGLREKMKSCDIDTDKHYIVRLGQWTELARVDATTTRTVLGKTSDVFVAWVYGLKQYRPLPASAFLHESLSPEEHAAIQARTHHEARAVIRGHVVQQQAITAASPLRVTEPLTGQIHRQGSVFPAGDYGITRE